jgi:hypothetical protein
MPGGEQVVGFAVFGFHVWSLDIYARAEVVLLDVMTSGSDRHRPFMEAIVSVWCLTVGTLFRRALPQGISGGRVSYLRRKRSRAVALGRLPSLLLRSEHESLFR